MKPPLLLWNSEYFSNYFFGGIADFFQKAALAMAAVVVVLLLWRALVKRTNQSDRSQEAIMGTWFIEPPLLAPKKPSGCVIAAVIALGVLLLLYLLAAWLAGPRYT